VIYTETVEKRGYSLEKFVDVVSTNAARILGLYPRKGAIAVGSDADLTVLVTSPRRTVRAQDPHESDHTPWEGKEVGASPALTVLRGKVMVADGRFHGGLKYLKRRIPEAVRTGSARQG
jgi:dihydropyrimidinase